MYIHLYKRLIRLPIYLPTCRSDLSVHPSIYVHLQVCVYTYIHIYIHIHTVYDITGQCIYYHCIPLMPLDCIALRCTTRHRAQHKQTRRAYFMIRVSPQDTKPQQACQEQIRAAWARLSEVPVVAVHDWASCSLGALMQDPACRNAIRQPRSLRSSGRTALQWCLRMCRATCWELALRVAFQSGHGGMVLPGEAEDRCRVAASQQAQ